MATIGNLNAQDVANYIDYTSKVLAAARECDADVWVVVQLSARKSALVTGQGTNLVPSYETVQARKDYTSKPEFFVTPKAKAQTIYTIPQKVSGSGSIHDIASDLFDRDIAFAPGCIYAVVLASYYGGKGYSTHKTEAAAIAASRSQRDFSHQIIDVQGKEYAADGDSLVQR